MKVNFQDEGVNRGSYHRTEQLLLTWATPVPLVAVRLVLGCGQAVLRGRRTDSPSLTCYIISHLSSFKFQCLMMYIRTLIGPTNIIEESSKMVHSRQNYRVWYEREWQIGGLSISLIFFHQNKQALNNRKPVQNLRPSAPPTVKSAPRYERERSSILI